MGSIRRFRPGSYLFDDIAHYDEETGEPWWLGRELMQSLGYPRWDSFEGPLTRAKATCSNEGYEPNDHFRQATKMIEIGRGGVRAVSDVNLSRFGCYLVAMNCDPHKPEVAAAQHYFAYRTRQAELAQAAHDATPPPVERAWSARLRETWQPHVQYLNTHFPNSFTVVSALGTQILFLEDELIRHMFRPMPSDRPDVSIGLCWSNYRKSRGLTPASHEVPLWLPDQNREVFLCVYGVEEMGAFMVWFNQTYLRDKLPDYLGNKPSFCKFGPLPPASAADHTCRGLTGQSAKLKPQLRRQLINASGFFPVGAKLPAIESQQRSLFD